MKYLFLILLTTCLLWHCSDVIIPDISDEQVLLRAPQDGDQLIGSAVTLSWEYLPDALDYQVEIATPDFENIQTLVIDSITTARNLTVMLAPGNYEWRVVAFNEVYASACCQEWSFQLQSNASTDLSLQTVSLLLPSNNASVGDGNVYWEWSPLAAATNYRFQLSTNADFTTLIQDSLLTNTSISLDNFEENQYYWRVRAESEISNSFTNYSTRNFTIDVTPPPSPVLNLPMENDTLLFSAQSPDFSWQSSNDSQHDTLYIFVDSFLDSLFFKKASLTGSTDLDDQSMNFAPGDYFWQVRSVDAAGNLSDLTASRKFIVE
jgi:hypothetical protein